MATKLRGDERPLIPGTPFRFGSLNQEATEVIRSEVQEAGDGLFVFDAPFDVGGSTPMSICEAYYPDEFTSGYPANLDPIRMSDFKDGRLVVLNTLGVRGMTSVGSGFGSINVCFRIEPQMIEEIRRNNRAARGELKRQSSAVHRKQAIKNAQEEEEQVAMKEWSDWYTDAYRETLKFAMNKPRVQGANLTS